MTPAAKLRAKLLDLAIRGKLVAQDPADEPADELLKRIFVAKAGGSRSCATAHPSPIPPEEQPFALPKGWVWCRLGDVGDWKAGATPSRKDPSYYVNGNTPWLKTGDLNDGVVNSVPEAITDKAVTETSVRLNPVGSVLIAMYGATIGKIGLLGIPATTNQACCACIVNEVIHNKYLFYYLMARREHFKMLGGGGAQPNISKDIIVSYPIPLPPLAEQKRIVEKLETLLKAVDTLGTCAEKFDKLGDKARAKILDLAIRGKLVAQNPTDEPADELLLRILARKNTKGCLTRRRGGAEKNLTQSPQSSQRYSNLCDSASLRDEGTSRTSRTLRDEEHPFTLPKGWAWCRLGDISCPINSKPHQILEKNVKQSGTYPVISQGQKYIDGYCECSEILIRNVPVVVFGDHTRNVKYVDFPFVVGADGTKIFQSLVDGRWLYYWTLHAASIQMESRGYGRHWNVLNSFPIPLPPLAEQKRIVAKVEALLAACEKLKGTVV